MITDYSNWVYNYNNKARLANMQRQESEEVECRPQPKPPYLGGHEIPGRKRNDLSLTVPAKKLNGRKVSSRLSRASREQRRKTDSLDSSQKQKVDKNPEGSKKKNEEMEVASSNFEADSLKNSSNILEENSYKEDDIDEAYDKRGNFEESDDQKNKKEGNSDSSDSFNSADSCESKSKDKNNDETYVYLNYTNRRRKYTIDLNNEHFDIDVLPWLSEYQDTIGETGDEILRTKLHYYGKLRLLPDYVAYKKKQADKKKDKDKKNFKQNSSF